MDELSIDELLATPNGSEKAVELAIRALINRESHHKQWYINQVLIALGVDLDELYQKLIQNGDIDEGDEWEEDIKGVAP